MLPLLLPLLLHAIAVLPFVAASPGDASCGALLPAVAAHCGYPDKPSRHACCDALRSWHRAECWCDVAAFAALRRIATNNYAFSGRADACGLKAPKLPPIPPAARGIPPPPATCAAIVTKPPLERDCEHPTKLANLRLDALNKLDALMLKRNSKQEIAEFRTKLANLLAPLVVFSNLGQISIIGARGVSDYLLARQRALGARANFAHASKRDQVQWRSARQASNTVYVNNTADEPGALTARMEFVTFAKCSARIAALTFAEAPYLSAQYSQYYYVRDGRGVVDQFDGCEKRLCASIRTACRGKLFPYASMRECDRFARKLKRERRVMCNRFEQKYVPQVALHGDTLACRSTYAIVARIDPEKYCAWLGEEGVGACRNSACPNQLYSDIFAKQGVPRVSGAWGTFSCSRKTGICTEQWL